MENRLIPWWKIDIGDEEAAAVARAIEDRHINQGPVTAELESRLAELLDVPYALLVTNGSAALLMALTACGIEPGDEVIVPACTFISTAQAPILLGARVKLVDTEVARPVIDVGGIESAVTPRTKAVIAVHLNGRGADIASLNRLAEKHGIIVIEDAAQALCSKNRAGFHGTQGTIGTFSLSITKLLTTGEGGLVVTRDRALFERMRKIRNHGIGLNGLYDLPGFNFKFTDLQAAVGLCQITKIEGRITALKKLYHRYREGLRDLQSIRLPDVDLENGELPLWVEVVCAERERIISLLRARDIQAKPFPPSCAEAPYIRFEGDFPNARYFAEHGLVLPSGPDQKDGDIERVIAALGEIDTQKKLNIRERG